jgi:hypothetical protein
MASHRRITLLALSCLSIIGSSLLAAQTVRGSDADVCLPKQAFCGPRGPAPANSIVGLREARAGEVWLSAPEHIAASAVRAPVSDTNTVNDSTRPQPPDNLRVNATPLGVNMSWDAAADDESGIDYYAYAIGSGNGDDKEADLQWWQSTASDTNVRVNLPLNTGAQIYVSVYAVNRAGLQSEKLRSAPLTVSGSAALGDAANSVQYELAKKGFDSNGKETAGWAPETARDLSRFLDRMLPVLNDVYGPPATGYNVTLIRDLRRTASAIFYPSTDAIHLGDKASYQLITHELIHAWRNDRILSSNKNWDYDATLSSFEEGFAQAVSYAAMTEFAKRNPDFPLSERVYQSSTEWDYDFHNVPALGTTDFWSDAGGTQLYWIRYEMAAAAIGKIAVEHPGFYKAFNAEYYRRLNANPRLRPTRALIIEVIAAVAPVIEGKPAAQWIELQHIFASKVTTGRKIWRHVQHYPIREFYVFNRLHTYETFRNGSDWSINERGRWRMYNSNGLRGFATVRDASGKVILETQLAISPADNPPKTSTFGSEKLDFTTGEGELSWPEDQSKLHKAMTALQLYSLETTFLEGRKQYKDTGYMVLGSELRTRRGIFGGVIGAREGTLRIVHRGVPASANEAPLTVRNGAFAGERSWASQKNPGTDSIDTVPGVIDVTFTDSSGRVYTDSRAIQLGNFNGSQAFLFDLSKMKRVS